MTQCGKGQGMENTPVEGDLEANLMDYVAGCILYSTMHVVRGDIDLLSPASCAGAAVWEMDAARL